MRSRRSFCFAPAILGYFDEYATRYANRDQPAIPPAHARYRC
jgi:hypothetical protein